MLATLTCLKNILCLPQMNTYNCEYSGNNVEFRDNRQQRPFSTSPITRPRDYFALELAKTATPWPVSPLSFQVFARFVS